jgi:hypothetical protein
LHLRAEITDGTAGGIEIDQPRKRKFGESVAFRFYGLAWSAKHSYEFGTKVTRIMQNLVARDGKIGKASGVVAKLVPPLGAWTKWRDAPVVAKRSFREEWRTTLSLDDEN